MLTRTLVSRRFSLLGITAAVALVACQSTNSPPPPAQQRAAPAEPATKVTLVTDSSQVCMVNNQFMGRPQIPVQVDGKTYYGCCAMCKGRLQSDASTRAASDPVSHKPVDKATAVIGRLPNGSTLYFASRANFDTYSQRAPAP